jgi:cell wall-associated NlpC family hydrolase
VSEFDPRLHPYRRDVAAAHLRGQVSAERFVEGTQYEVIEPIADLRRAPSADAPLDTQALYGERVTVYESNGEGWAWAQLETDSYVGWLPENALGKRAPPPTYKVIVPRTLVFPAPDIKRPPLAALPMNAQLVIAREEGKFAIAANGWHLPAAHLAPLSTAYPDFVGVAEMFVGTPYLWGGKSALGFDCSGLVQVSMQAAGLKCPRDSDMQEAALGDSIDLKDLRRGDLLFWPGHVAIACDAQTMVHANAYHMMVAREPLDAALERIGAAGSALRAVKRI